jgi:hypothetical protein
MRFRVRVYFFTLMWIQIQLFTLMRKRIRILFLIEVCESAATGLTTLQSFISKLHASIVKVQGHPRLHFEPLMLLNFELNADQIQMLIWIPAVLLSLPCAVADPDRLFLRSKRILVQKYLDFFAEWGGGGFKIGGLELVVL